jgi:hypothetical protein
MSGMDTITINVRPENEVHVLRAWKDFGEATIVLSLKTPYAATDRQVRALIDQINKALGKELSFSSSKKVDKGPSFPFLKNNGKDA